VKGTQRKTWQTLFMVLPAIMLCVLFCKTDVMAATKNHTMKANTKYNINNTNYDTTTFHKITVPSTGRIKLTGWAKDSADSSIKRTMYVRLYNSKKKALEGKYISGFGSVNSYTSYYAVKKGVYYVKVSDYKNYRIKYTFTKVTDKSGSTKAKALNMKYNTKYMGVLTAGEKGTTADWYKFKLTKNQKFSLYYGIKANDNIRIQVYPESGTILNSYRYHYRIDSSMKTNGVFKAGTYYVKVSRQGNDKSTNGYYYLRWK